MSKMTEPQIQGRMAEAKGWDRVGDMLVRSWNFPSSRRALEFVGLATAVAERLDHHPDFILSYRTVRVELSTHAEGGLTDRDFAMVVELNALPTDR